MNRKRGNKGTAFLIGLIIPICCIIVWQILGNKGVINQAIMPKPTTLVEKFIPLLKNGTLLRNLTASLKRVLTGYVIGAFMGIILGIIIGFYPFAEKMTAFMVGILRPIPALACIPILILALGIGEESKIAVIMIGSFWPVLLNTIQGIHGVDEKLIQLGNVLEKSRFQMISGIIIPSAFPSIFTGLRLGISSSWTNIVAAEMIAASAGMGYMISYAREMSQPAQVLIGIFTIGIVGLMIDIIVIALQKKIVYWE
ncbi:MAG: ABC transporter permease [Schaedlerella sp.]|nr:ABC transporter permease [Lachnospiraceae bacterium]MDY4202054.1 ABC transporter permease [Schaedlerella sp.]